MKVYGPYERKDGRRHVILYENGVRTTQSYPRYLMEQHLGRKLTENEEVDHINEDVGDDRIENLQLLSKFDNLQKSRFRLHQAQLRVFICPICDREFELTERQYKGNQIHQNKPGPYCSRSCAGKANAAKRQY